MTSTLLYYRSPWTLANFGEGIVNCNLFIDKLLKNLLYYMLLGTIFCLLLRDVRITAENRQCSKVPGKLHQYRILKAKWCVNQLLGRLNLVHLGAKEVKAIDGTRANTKGLNEGGGGTDASA